MTALGNASGSPFRWMSRTPTFNALMRSALLRVESDVGGADSWNSDHFSIANNADPTPDQYDSITNRGTAGGTIGNSGTARHSVSHNVGGGQARRVLKDDGSNDLMVSSLAASAWSSLHTGDVHVILPVRLHASGAADLFATCDTVGETGLRIALDGSDKVQADLCNGTGTAYLSATTAAALTVGHQYIVEVVRDGSTLTVNAYDYTGVLETTGQDSSTAGAAPSGNPAKTASWGGASGNYGAVHAWPRSLPDSSIVRNHLRGRFCDSWWEELIRALDGGLYAAAKSSFYTLSGSDVSRILDLSGRARDCYTIAGGTISAINGEPAFSFGGSSTTAIVSPGLGFDSSTTHHMFFMLDPDAATGRNKFLLDSATGRLVFAQFGNVADKLGIFTGAAWTCDAADPTANVQLLEYEVQGTAQIARRDGSQIDTDVGTAIAIGGETRYFSRNNSSTISLYAGKCSVYGRGSAAISGADLTSLQAKLQSLGGV